jgi:hypothetical protein
MVITTPESLLRPWRCRLKDLIPSKVSTDPGRHIGFFSPKVSSEPGWNPDRYLIYPRVCEDPWIFLLHTLKLIATLFLNISQTMLFIFTASSNILLHLFLIST